MSDFFKGKKCAVCGKDATCAHFGRFLCGSKECMDEARETKDCVGKTMEPPKGTVRLDELTKKK